jgi:hypothetical protein
MKIHTVIFYKAVRLGKEMIESCSTNNQKFTNVEISEFKDVGLKLTQNGNSIVVPFANIACFSADEVPVKAVKAAK